MAKFTDTQKGDRKLIYNGFGYVKKRDGSEKITWNCELKTAKKCSAFAKTAINCVEGGDVEEFWIHRHDSDASIFEVVSAKRSLKRKAMESVFSTSVIVSEMVGGTSAAAFASLPAIGSLKRNVQRYRSANLAPLPKKISDLIIPEKLKRKLDGKDFLLMDDSFGKEAAGRFLIFGTEKNREILEHCNFWLADGTFSVVPSIFQQLYTKFKQNVKMITALFFPGATGYPGCRIIRPGSRDLACQIF